MDNGIYVTLSRQLALFRDMETTANNIANANTVGYNEERLLFKSYLTKDINQGVTNPMSFAYDINTFRDSREGPIRATGNALDLAITGDDAFFAIETPLGTRYTKAGNFQLDGEGTLVNAEGYPVLDNSGQRIVFPDDTQTIEVGETGNVKVNGEEFALMGVHNFSNPRLLEPMGGGLYKSEVDPEDATEARVVQGALQDSNVQPVLELTHMIDVSRAVGSTAKFIETMYDLQRKTNSTWTQQG